MHYLIESSLTAYATQESRLYGDSDVVDLKLIVGDRISILVTFVNVGARGQCTRIQL